jgi:putative oxidoreductase
MKTAQLKKFFLVKNQSAWNSGAFLLLRLVAGYAFVLHGWPKFQNATHWMGPDSPVPALFQFLAAFAEFGGGLAWILGLLFPLASLGLICTMGVAMSFHIFVKGDPFVGQSSYELAAIYLCMSVLFMVTGPGKYSLDQKVFGKRSG